MNRRQGLGALLATALVARASAADAAKARPMSRLATAWQWQKTGSRQAGFELALLQAHWDEPRLDVQARIPVPTRAHGLLALPDGGFVAVANRPGHWLLLCDAQGRVRTRWNSADDQPERSFNGHLACSADAHWLYSTETDMHNGSSWISVRDSRTLQRVAEFPTGGWDAHHLLRTASGQLVVANGGITRDAAGRKINTKPLASSLALLNPETGQLIGLWTLPDPHLSMRHLAWMNTAGQATLALGLQAEHPSTGPRASAPALALWQGQELSLPCSDAATAGYVGDICSAPSQGCIVSAQKQGRSHWWQPDWPHQLTTVAELQQTCGLAPESPGDGGAVIISAARGLARWHPQLPPRLLPWPAALAPDNHIVALVDA